jgi:LysM repeat protein
MAPNAKDAQAISIAFDRKVILKREQQTISAKLGDDAPTQKSNLPRETRENLRLATVEAPVAIATPAAISTAIATPSQTYVVKPGDTLFSIAKRAGVSLAELKAANQMTSNSVNVGQALQLTSSTASTASDAAPTVALVSTASVAAKSTPTRTHIVHIVRAGDTLFSIAKRFNTTVANLLVLNQLTAKSVLKTGARLQVSR